MTDAAKPDVPACVINCAVYDREGRRSNIGLDAISDVLAHDDGSFVWVGLYQPSDAILDKLQEEFGLHDLAVEDAQRAHQRPKIEAYGNSLFIAVNTAQAEEDNTLGYGETLAFLGPRYLITVRHGASRSYASARSRVEREPELLALGPSYGLYAVLDFIVDNYLPIVSGFKDTLRRLEKDVLSDSYRRDTILHLYDLKRELTYMRVAVAPLQDVLAQLSRTTSPLIPEEVRLYFRDVYDHAVRVNESIDAMRDMLGTAMSVNQSLVTLAQGEVVKRLAGWAALLAAPTLIASWYGMNFHNMPELHGRYSYFVLIAVVAAVCLGLYRYLKKVRWL
ncbi:MAG TPA: magnesium/cobalt transporter CorA [Pseudoxanthomonas sp.]|uniref:Magnesium transport protein CorA n=1 Tax=Pseudoxanthomonas helianthi TaxID=1453541 RepID=A0A940WYF3_9GAMM|nr:magnesium/cobalt transporter CorA [Pseudoxanthomonas helianthi]MBP3982947.1 magnesium/cobalt transporter CorA [Pseudoxanthomonas helianthi]HWU70819.1 magnesium/cobalt transporter CorA [Pseudoxanthomonas sp.]